MGFTNHEHDKMSDKSDFSSSKYHEKLRQRIDNESTIIEKDSKDFKLRRVNGAVIQSNDQHHNHEKINLNQQNHHHQGNDVSASHRLLGCSAACPVGT